MKYIWVILLLFVCTGNVIAQTAEDSVKAVVISLFTAMKNADAELFKSVFSKSAMMQTINSNKDGQIAVVTESIDDFATFVCSLKKQSADERIQFETIKIDGPLALAWTHYEFYMDVTFSHCGVNSFQLVRLEGKWKIQYIIDTRKKQGCKK